MHIGPIDMQMDQILVAAFIMIAAAGVLYALVYPHLSGQVRAEKRQAAYSRSNAGAKKASDRNVDAANRRRQIADTLKDLEQKDKKKRVSLETKIGQAGLTISKNAYLGASIGAGTFLALILLLLSGEFYIAIPALLVGGIGLPSWFLSFLKNRRIKKFVNEFPNAIDVIIRGVKSGLPLGDCLRIVASEAQEPVRGEFRAIVEATTVGLSVGEAAERLVDRVPIPETNFFAIVINIQQKAGGNLSEALGNLSRVLRDRKKMELKIKAMSSEAKASAGIIGSLPFIVTLLVYLSSPSYIELLWTTSTGLFVLAASGIWMSIGVMSMRKMVSFDI
jgi:tight adherence protein B